MAQPGAVNRSLAIRLAIFGGGLVCGVVLAALIVVNGGFEPAASLAPVSAPAMTPTAAAASSPSAAPAGPATLSSEARTAVDARINELESRLAITSAQQTRWSAFARAMRDNAAATEALLAQRAGAVGTMSAIENMRSYAAIARAYAENTERLATAFDDLYASLSDPQKRAADMLFREQAEVAAKPQPTH